MGNCTGFCVTSNQATNAGEETIQGNVVSNKGAVTRDKVKSALMEKDDLMLNEGAAGAAQYEEAYNNNNRNTGYNAGTI